MKHPKPTISILGTGWLGLPLAKALQTNGHVVKGATTSPNRLQELSTAGITPFVVTLTENQVLGDVEEFLSGSHRLIINIPPGLRRHPHSNFVQKIESFLPHLQNSGIKKVLYISSTSVFADQEGFPLITADSIPNAQSMSGRQLIQVEQLLQNTPWLDTTVLRFGGLFDNRRHPATMLARRQNIKNPKAPLNLIHRQDCIGIIRQILESDVWNETFNAAYPAHPQKQDYYSKICRDLGLSLPDYDLQTPSKGKIIAAQKVQSRLEYAFQRNLYQL